jgi:hypothetical protein
MQRDLVLGAVQRLAAAVGLQVDRIAGSDEGGDVGDRVMQHVAVAVARDVQGLVQVHRAGRIDRDEGNVVAILGGQSRMRGGFARGGLDIGGEGVGQGHFGADARDAGFERGNRRAVGAEPASSRHRPRIPSAARPSPAGRQASKSPACARSASRSMNPDTPTPTSR